jgi:hypothetical protein
MVVGHYGDRAPCQLRSAVNALARRPKGSQTLDVLILVMNPVDTSIMFVVFEDAPELAEDRSAEGDVNLPELATPPLRLLTAHL